MKLLCYLFSIPKLKTHLADKAKIWNEDELKMFFIGPLIEEAGLTTKDFQPFTQRQFSATIGNEEIGGRVDFLVAKGRRLPELPYLCIHEYKQEPSPRLRKVSPRLRKVFLVHACARFHFCWRKRPLLPAS